MSDLGYRLSRAGQAVVRIGQQVERWLTQRNSPIEVEGLRWRLRRALENRPRAEQLFDRQAALEALRGAQGRFITLPWIASHSGALLALFDPGSELVCNVPLFRAPEQLRHRQRINAFIVERPAAYRRILRELLLPVRNQIAGLLVTLDWAPVMRQAVYACRELGIPTVLVPHEAVFADRDRYYVDRLTGADVPACDLVLCWGELQRDIFAERGFNMARMHVVGSAKLDEAKRYQAVLSRIAFAERYELRADQPIVLFAAQPLDSQYSAEQARAAQTRAVSDLLELCEQRHAQLLVRLPPSGHEVLPADLMERLRSSRCARVDGSPHRTSAHEAIHHASSVCSINSTMLLEAVIMGRPALSTHYLDFDELWSRAGIPAAHDRAELEQHAELLFAGGSVVAGEGLAWAARAFSAGAFDGSSAQRIRIALERLRAEPHPVRDAAAEFADDELARDLTAVVFDAPANVKSTRGVRRALPAATLRSGQLADVLIVSAHSKQRRKAERWAEALGRPLLVRP